MGSEMCIRDSLDVSKIRSDSLELNELYENGEIDIVGAIYGVQTGVVSFFVIL